MKKLIVLIVAVTGLASVGSAQAKKPVQTVTINTPAVLCDVCKQRIEEFMKREEGVIKVNVDLKKKVTRVTYYTNRTNVENIKTGIANAGFDADDVKADEDAYSRLPKCCKKTEKPVGHRE